MEGVVTAASDAAVFDRALLAALPDGVVVYAADGRCLFANEAATRLLGVSCHEFLAQDYDRLTLWKALDFSGCGLESIVAGKADIWEGPFSARGGMTRWLLVRRSWAQTLQGPVLLVVVSDLTARKKAEKTSSLSRASVERSSDPIYWVSPAGRILFVNDAGCRRYGYTRKEMLRLTVADLTPGLTEQDWQDRWAQIKSQRSLTLESVHGTKSGELFPVEVAANYFVHDGKEYNVAFVRDTSDRKLTEETLRLTKLSVDKAADLIHWIDPQGHLLYVSDSICVRTGYTRDELLGMTVFDLDPLQTPASWKKHWQLIKQQGSTVMESVHRTKSGELFPVELTVNFVESRGTEYNFAFARDVSERKGHERELVQAKEALEQAYDKLEEEVKKTHELNHSLNETQEILKYQALTDPLTGVMNRWAVLARLKEEEARADREGTYLGIGVIDVDHFKKVNDHYGHMAGDKVLKIITARISRSIRPYDLVGRFGGEEFLVVLPGADENGARVVLERLRRAVSDSPAKADGHLIPVTLSAGGASGRGVSTDELIRAADQALYRAKRNGRNQVVIAESKLLHLKAV
jgi:diguanylate cyclase (GGDEF)-like protein/PAS domain S-box-containing protein